MRARALLGILAVVALAALWAPAKAPAHPARPGAAARASGAPEDSPAPAANAAVAIPAPAAADGASRSPRIPGGAWLVLAALALVAPWSLGSRRTVAIDTAAAGSPILPHGPFQGRAPPHPAR